ncbi:hypothetical protein SY27_10920 [Flavobacterium sp. 316]|uniref:PAS domain-containing protein n=1 Tax=Flavobacterium sediminilitoris TaxID=2024526 RepID=A0ABY4HTA1_9FLAO|nr:MULTISPECIES: PAS domain-containing protein [Flavobacterium]KIX21253.1 hypothetical protein SY27_10920 [Flavobacterium sp. 316]UOX34984.1 PAS domain-containing protein [Flavobacterium sediminilitoris]
MFEEYEKALEKHQKSLKVTSLPLISWDFYGLQMHEIKEFNTLQNNWKDKIVYVDIIESKKVIIVTDHNFKIIFSSRNVTEMNGYNYREIIGKSPRIFQGKETSEETKNNIRLAIKERKPFKEVILNYKKNGETYLCEIDALPKFDRKGNFLNYIAFEKTA